MSRQRRRFHPHTDDGFLIVVVRGAEPYPLDRAAVAFARPCEFGAGRGVEFYEVHRWIIAVEDFADTPHPLCFLNVEGATDWYHVLTLDHVDLFLGDRRAVAPGGIGGNLFLQDVRELRVDNRVAPDYQVFDCSFLVRIRLNDSVRLIRVPYEPLRAFVVDEVVLTRKFTDGHQVVNARRCGRSWANPDEALTESSARDFVLQSAHTHAVDAG